ncbi:hypothetical protein NE237_032256 [Protea cynaroides]|uniref:FBD domain-containing protein n=1 Tax=Protea cynaroides TaxID=273540 RepID=A0A9Q0R382_9MAGN|nr:hypothetical protein NE237_032256 [Protea cynaroides]
MNENEDMLLICLYVDDLIFTKSNPKIFEEFKKEMTHDFEMTDIGLMSYYLGIEIKQMKNGIFIFQEGFAKEMLKKFMMNDCKLINTVIEIKIMLLEDEDEEMEHSDAVIRDEYRRIPELNESEFCESQLLLFPCLTHLEKVEINGFGGRKREMELVKYLLQKSFLLNEMVIIHEKCHNDELEFLKEKLDKGEGSCTVLSMVFDERSGSGVNSEDGTSISGYVSGIGASSLVMGFQFLVGGR